MWSHACCSGSGWWEWFHGLALGCSPCNGLASFPTQHPAHAHKRSTRQQPNPHNTHARSLAHITQTWMAITFNPSAFSSPWTFSVSSASPLSPPQYANTTTPQRMKEHTPPVLHAQIDKSSLLGLLLLLLAASCCCFVGGWGLWAHVSLSHDENSLNSSPVPSRHRLINDSFVTDHRR